MPNHNDSQLDQVFSALADPTRRAVVQRLASMQQASVSELHADHAMALPSFMQHLKVLENAGLVSTRKEGRMRVVNIEAQPLSDAQKWLERQRRVWEARFDRLDALLATMPDPHEPGDTEADPRDR